MSSEKGGAVVIRARKFKLNRLLARKQMIIDVLHPSQANVSKDRLKTILAKKFKVEDKTITLFGFKTAFGGGKSTGFCLIYDNFDYLKKYEPKYRLRRIKLLEPRTGGRKARKEIKSKRKRVRGKAKGKVVGGKK
jgi:small subunit ribosomal protein S24e